MGKLNRFIDRNIEEKAVVEPYILNCQPNEKGSKIIHVNGNFIIGGNTQLIVDIIERTSHRYSHEIVVPAHPRRLPYQPVRIHKFAVSQMNDLYEYFERQKPALVHINYWVKHPDRHRELSLWFQAVYKICEELKLKVIQNVTIPAYPFHSPSIVHNVFVSKFVAENFNDDGETPWSVIYPGSDFTHFKNDDVAALPDDSIGMVYRLDTDKLNPEAIEIFIAVVKRKPDAKCVIVGGGYYFDYYQKRVADENMEKNFIFTGFVSYKLLPDYYKKMSVFVVPAHNESFGQVTPFAMSMGLTVAGYDVGAIKEILGSSDTLVEYGNIEGLADVIVELMKNREKRLSIGRANQQRARENFSVEQMIAEYEKLYESFIPNAD